MNSNVSTINLAMIPYEVMANNILPGLPYTDLLGSIPYVCKRFDVLANDNNMWKTAMSSIFAETNSLQNLHRKKICVIQLSNQLESDLKQAIKHKQDAKADSIFQTILMTGCRPPMLDALTYITLPKMFVEQQFLDMAVYWIEQMKRAKLEAKGNTDFKMKREEIDLAISNLNPNDKLAQNLITMLNLYIKEEDMAGAAAYIDIEQATPSSPLYKPMGPTINIDPGQLSILIP